MGYLAGYLSKDLDWTNEAKLCYSSGCNCRECTNRFESQKQCQMRRVVLELVRRFGAPKGVEVKGILRD